jgi:hypothetical protein
MPHKAFWILPVPELWKMGYRKCPVINRPACGKWRCGINLLEGGGVPFLGTASPASPESGGRLKVAHPSPGDLEREKTASGLAGGSG